MQFTLSSSLNISPLDTHVEDCFLPLATWHAILSSMPTPVQYMNIRSQTITVRVSIVSSSQFSYRFSAYPFFFFLWNQLIFIPLLFWSEVGNLQYKKRNPAPDIQSLKRHGSLLWSFVSEGLGAGKDTVSLLGLLWDSKFLRFTGFILFCLADVLENGF